jgi:hypothetical protein
MEPVSTPRKGSRTTARLDATDSAVTISPYLIRRHREELNSWVRANGLNPEIIPDHLPIRVEEGSDGCVIRYWIYVLDEEGQSQPDPTELGALTTEERTAPCTVPPPDLGSVVQPESDPKGEFDARSNTANQKSDSGS